VLNEEQEWIAEFEAVGESELRDRLYRGSGIHPEAKFHTAVRCCASRRERADSEKNSFTAMFGGRYAPPSCR
jgi:hypothetical protein